MNERKHKKKKTLKENIFKDFFLKKERNFTLEKKRKNEITLK